METNIIQSAAWTTTKSYYTPLNTHRHTDKHTNTHKRCKEWHTNTNKTCILIITVIISPYLESLGEQIRKEERRARDDLSNLSRLNGRSGGAKQVSLVCWQTQKHCFLLLVHQFLNQYLQTCFFSLVSWKGKILRTEYRSKPSRRKRNKNSKKYWATHKERLLIFFPRSGFWCLVSAQA